MNVREMLVSLPVRAVTLVRSPQLRWYGIVGVLSTCVDFVLYSLFALVLPFAFAKALSFITATVFSYLGHQIFTFRQPRTTAQAVRFFVVYILSLGINVLANQIKLEVQPDWTYRIAAAFVVATGSSIVFNFLCLKLIVFVPRTSY